MTNTATITTTPGPIPFQHLMYKTVKTRQALQLGTVDVWLFKYKATPYHGWVTLAEVTLYLDGVYETRRGGRLIAETRDQARAFEAAEKAQRGEHTPEISPSFW